MKKFILAAAVASMLATPALAAPNNGRDSRGQIEQRSDRNAGPQRQAQQHRWNKGERFDQRKASSYRVISNPRQYRLKDAPRGYRYVQSGNDAVLIGITSGVVAAVFANMIR